MRAAPALRLRLESFGVWHAALLGLALLDLLCLVAWAMLRPASLPAWAWGAVLAGAALGALAAGALRRRAVDLDWDGQAWSLGEPGAAAVARIRGERGVRLDLGRWMLLRFAPAGRGPASVAWLPVQRRGLERQWHALRCAVFSPRDVPPRQGAPDPS